MCGDLNRIQTKINGITVQRKRIKLKLFILFLFNRNSNFESLSHRMNLNYPACGAEALEAAKNVRTNE